MITPLPPIDPEESKIQYFFQDIQEELSDLDSLIPWLLNVASDEGKEIYQLQIVFMTDDALLEMNQTYLGHDYYTDIITFPLNEDPIMGELYISYDRVCDNAKSLEVSEWEEIARVMVHGILHLCGYQDHNAAEKKVMRNKEDHYLKGLKK
jgi:rRNA maturation RNase YbeY